MGTKRFILCFFLYIFSLKAYCQIKIDRNLPAKFNEVSLSMESIYRSAFLEMNKKNEFESLGVGIITSYKIDTLNINDLIKDLKSEVILSDPETGLEEKLTDQNMYPPYPDFVKARMEGNKLKIYTGLFQPSINHVIENFKVESYLEEYLKNDKVFQLNLNEEKVDQLKIPIKTKKFVLNKNEFKVGDIIYGLIEFESSAYYNYSNVYDFKNGYIKQRIKGSYLFKAEISN
jgi:hypothetical protein